MTADTSPEAIAALRDALTAAEARVAELKDVDAKREHYKRIGEDYRSCMIDERHRAEAAEARIAALTAAINDLVSANEGASLDAFNAAYKSLAAFSKGGQPPPTEYERKVAKMKKEFPNGI